MQQLSILLAEDEILIRSDVREILENNGYTVCAECGDGLEAMELAQKIRPELAILDIVMPKVDGLETAKFLYSLNIPVVLLTAYTQNKFIKRAEAVHAFGYVVKPVAEESLLAAIRIAYARWREMCDIHRELKQTKDRLEDQKIIAKAQSVLQDYLGLSAQAAHKRLIKEAMQRQITLAKMADQIIKKINKK